MTNEEKIKEFESIVMDKEALNDIRPYKRNMWEEIKKDESVLATGIRVTSRTEDKADSLLSPIVGSLILMDYKNVDKLIYDVMIRLVYNNPNIASTVNPLNGYSLLETSLFNNNIGLNRKQVIFLLDETTKLNSKIFSKQAEIAYPKNNEEDTLRSLLDLIGERNNHIYFINKPKDIRYFILTNTSVMKYFDETPIKNNYYNKLFIDRNWLEYYKGGTYIVMRDFMLNEINDKKNLNILLEDAEERVKIRKLGRVPF